MLPRGLLKPSFGEKEQKDDLASISTVLVATFATIFLAKDAEGESAEMPPLLRPGDILQLKLVIHADGKQVLKEYTVVLEVRVVADPSRAT